MKQSFPIRLTFTITSFIILFLYSSEMDFMSNYIDRPDKIYLGLWMLLIYPVLIFMIGWALLKSKIKAEKMEISICTIIAILGFAMLNDPKGDSQVMGYLIILFLWMISMIRLILIRRSNWSS